jgi:hypothetical protein
MEYENLTDALWCLSPGETKLFDDSVNIKSIRVIASRMGKDYDRKYVSRSIPFGGYQVWRIA